MTATKPLLRWSSVRDCARKSIYEAEGAPARERTPAEEGTLWRGKSIGREYTIFLATQMGARIWVSSGPDFWVPPDLKAADEKSAGLIAEQTIRWQHGVGHSDIYLPETKTIVEVLSSAHASEAMTRAKLLQAVGYTEHHPQAENCALVIVSPTDFTTERIVLSPRSTAYKDLRTEMRERIGDLDNWAETSTLPGRVCGRPSDARSHFCLFADHCFEGWQPTEPDEIEADETVVDALVRFDRAKKARAAVAREDKALKVEQDAAQEILAGLELPAGTVRLGPYEVTRTFVQRKPTFQADRAEMAGVFEPGLYSEFFRAGASYSTYRIDLVGDPIEEDYGSEAPWDDDDLGQPGGLH